MAKTTLEPVPEAQNVLVEEYREDQGNGDTGDDAPVNDPDTPDSPVDGPFLASQSQMAPENPGDYQKARSAGKRGRPPGSGAVPEVGILGGKPLPVPRPHIRVYRSDAIGGQKKNTAFYSYWNDLPAWAKTYTQAYIYRHHPVLKDPPIDPATKKPVDFKYIDKIAGEEPLQSDHDLLNKYGCGSYKIVFNEMASPGDKRNTLGGELCEVYAMNVGGGDYKSNPPTDRRINNLENLDLSDPNNASYVGFLRGKGIIPEEINKQKEEAEMATIQAAEQQGKVIENLTAKVMEMADRRSQEPVSRGVGMEDVRAEIATANRLLLADIRELVRPTQTAPPVPQKDPMELALQLVTMLQSAGGANAAELAELRAQVAQQSQEQVRVLSDQVKTLIESRTTGAASGTPFSGVKDGMAAMKELRDTLQELGVQIGGNDRDTVADAAEAAGIPKWLTVVAPLAQQAIATFGQVLMAGKVPPAPAPMPQTPVTQNPGAAGLPAPAPVAPPPSTIPPGFPPELARLLDSISYPLLNYLNDPDATGDSFASFFTAGWGDEAFVQVKGFGLDGVMQALAAYPLTAQLLAPVPMERVTKFVGEFLAADPATDNEEDDEDKPDDTGKKLEVVAAGDVPPIKPAS